MSNLTTTINIFDKSQTYYAYPLWVIDAQGTFYSDNPHMSAIAAKRIAKKINGSIDDNDGQEIVNYTF